MSNAKKMTKKDYFNAMLAIPAVAENKAMVEFINHEIELLAKKNSANRKPTAQQVENASLKEVILGVLVDSGKAMTVTEIQKSSTALVDLSNQRVSALVRQLMDSGEVARVEDKRKAYFKAVQPSED